MLLVYALIIAQTKAKAYASPLLPGDSSLLLSSVASFVMDLRNLGEHFLFACVVWVWGLTFPCSSKLFLRSPASEAMSDLFSPTPFARALSVLTALRRTGQQKQMSHNS